LDLKQDDFIQLADPNKYNIPTKNKQFPLNNKVDLVEDNISQAGYLKPQILNNFINVLVYFSILT